MFKNNTAVDYCEQLCDVFQGVKCITSRQFQNIKDKVYTKKYWHLVLENLGFKQTTSRENSRDDISASL